MSDVTLNTDPLDRESIAALAYRLWQQRGCPQGSGEDDWLQAESTLTSGKLPLTTPVFITAAVLLRPLSG